MPQKRILPYVIMGILLDQDCTGKQIVDEFRYDIGEFWKASHSQVYPELKRMEQDRWVTSYAKENNDKEIYYHLTDEGHRIISEWLTQPVKKLPASKDLFSLKVFFISDRHDPRLKQLIERQIKLTRDNLQHLQQRQNLLFADSRQIERHYGHYLILSRAINRQANQLAWLEEKAK